ncbi:MAG: hypothetical protein HYZ11_08415 [Candidatus Tectomicrobia bacterium]|uniref:Calcium-binding protein n=1 Tax=Tectimicrobiota bacterium TaxID=2528274 RepID=A0A932I0D1_UNCTE|nr:hypothetical protein [Candidatus Tectomicrobia bacterium]
MPSLPRLSLAACLLGALLAGCAPGSTVSDEAWKALSDSIQKEFDLLVQEFDALDARGDLELCQPVQFAVARFAVYQVIEERRASDLTQLTRLITRARRALRFPQQALRDKQCVDSDGDGLTDLEEVRVHKTHPGKADTDGDGLQDGDEVRRHRTDPLKLDTDGDLLGDGEEALFYKTSPLRADSDGDGYPDGLEVFLGSDPLDPCSLPKGQEDKRLPGPYTQCRPRPPGAAPPPRPFAPKPAPRAPGGLPAPPSSVR